MDFPHEPEIPWNFWVPPGWKVLFRRSVCALITGTCFLASMPRKNDELLGHSSNRAARRRTDAVRACAYAGRFPWRRQSPRCGTMRPIAWGALPRMGISEHGFSQNGRRHKEGIVGEKMVFRGNGIVVLLDGRVRRNGGHGGPIQRRLAHVEVSEQRCKADRPTMHHARHDEV